MEPYITLVLTLEKQTKNKLVYANKDSAIPSVYIEKSALATTPKTITITVHCGDRTNG